jgi:hypothetical protein
MDWAEGLKTRFSVLCVVMMGRIDWLRDVGTGLGKDVLAIALEIWMIFDRKRRMASMDWAKGGERNGWEGYGGRKEGKSGFGKDKLGRICVQVFVEVISRV